MEKALRRPENADVLGNKQLVVIHGQLSRATRSRLMKKIAEEENILLLITFGVGAVGLNLQKFTKVLFLDRCYNPQIHICNFLFFVCIFFFSYTACHSF